MKLEEKIDYEFQCFFLDQMRTSKENIFARSSEIQVKKELAGELKALIKNLDEPTEELLMLQSNLLESAYCFCKDVSLEEGKNIRKALEGWLIFLVQKKAVAADQKE